MDLLIVSIRTLFFYFFILICYKVMGRRELSNLSISDFTISLLIAELVAISIENKDDSMFLTLLPILLLVFLEVFSSFLELKFKILREVVDGKPSIIINNGKLNIKEMIKHRYSLEDLLLSLRSANISSISDVNYAILETNGKLSTFVKNDKEYPLPLIVNGCVDKDMLLSINKNRIWLDRLLRKKDLSVKEIIYAFYKNNKLYVIKK